MHLGSIKIHFPHEIHSFSLLSSSFFPPISFWCSCPSLSFYSRHFPPHPPHNFYSESLPSASHPLPQNSSLSLNPSFPLLPPCSEGLLRVKNPEACKQGPSSSSLSCSLRAPRGKWAGCLQSYRSDPLQLCKVTAPKSLQLGAPGLPSKLDWFAVISGMGGAVVHGRGTPFLQPLPEGNLICFLPVSSEPFIHPLSSVWGGLESSGFDEAAGSWVSLYHWGVGKGRGRKRGVCI